MISHDHAIAIISRCDKSLITFYAVFGACTRYSIHDLMLFIEGA